MPDDIRPVPGDNSEATVVKFIDLADGEWLLASDGKYQTYAVETMLRDGSNWQRALVLEYPVRVNKTNDYRTIRLIISPEDALGLSDVMAHTSTWLIAAALIEGTDNE